MYYLMLAFIQAATEFLPISSSGHLLFFKGLFHTEDIPILFDIIIHVGSLTAIILYYRKRITGTLSGAFREWQERQAFKPHSKMLLYIAISTAVTFLFYVLFKEAIEANYQSPSVLFVTYLVTTVILFLTYFSEKGMKSDLSQKKVTLAIVVGLFQGFAIMPGISRSGSTISPLLLMGIKREDAAYYSFFLAIPAILGALVFKVAELEGLDYLTAHLGIIALSFVISAFFSYLFLVLLTFVLKKGRFWIFSGYTLVLAILAFVLFGMSGV